jgi:phospholipid transport system transporter-binding protein
VSGASLAASGDARWELAGALDFSSVPEIWLSLEKLLRAGGELTLSLSGVNHANSAGLVLLVEARDLARQGNCQLKLVDIPEELLDLARMSRCEDLIAVNSV